MVFGYRTCYPSLRFKLTEGLKWNYEKIGLSFTPWSPFFHTLFSPIWHRHTLLVRTHAWCARERTQNARVHTTSTPPATTAIARASERELMDCGADGHSGLFVYAWAVKIWLHLQVATPAAWRLCLSRRQWWVCVGISDAVRLDGESEFGSMCCRTWDVFFFFFFPGCVWACFVCFGDFGFEKHFGKIHYPLILLKGCLGFLLDRLFWLCKIGVGEGLLGIYVFLAAAVTFYLWVFFRKLVKKNLFLVFWSFWWGLSLTSHLLVDESRV